jgi:hypothetical protein
LLYSSGGDTSLESKFAAAGLRLSIIHRLGEWTKTKINCSEINASELTATDKIIANPTALLFKWYWCISCTFKIQHQTCDCFYLSIAGLA